MNLSIRIVSIILALALLLSGCALFSRAPDDAPLPASLEGLSVRAEQEGPDGMDITGAWIVEAPGLPSERELAAHLAIEPETAWQLEPAGDGRFRIRPQEPLAQQALYRVALQTGGGKRAHSWVFQTASPFRVIATTPRNYDEETGATTALDTGIEIVLSRSEVDISGSFSIDPPVEGTFLQYQNRCAFVPTNGLRPDTAYTVTLSGDLAAPDGAVLGEAYTFTFLTHTPYTANTPEHDKLWFYIGNGGEETFLPGDIPVLLLSAYNSTEEQAYRVEAFALTGEQYRQELLTRNRDLYDTAADAYKPPLITGREPFVAFESAASRGITASGGDRYYYSYNQRGIAFPEPLPAGHYLVQVSADDPESGEPVWDQKLVQISDTAVFTASVEGELLLWANNAATGGARSAMQAELTNPKTGNVLLGGSADSDGLALLQPAIRPQPEKEYTRNYGLLHIRNGDSPDYWDLLRLDWVRAETARERYISYSHTDRNLYRASDTVHYWAVVRGRREPVAADAAFNLVLRDANRYGYDRYSENTEPLATIPVELTDDGSVIAELPLEDVASGRYSLELVEAGGEERVILSDEFYVEQYTKQEYVMDTVTGKPYYLPGETMECTLQAAFFDGTPAAGMRFHSDIDGMEYTTGDDGRFTVAYVPEQERFYEQWTPQTVSFSFESNSQEARIFRVDGDAVYFPSELALRAEMQGAHSAAPSILIRTNAIDPSGVVEGGSIYHAESYLGGPVDTEVSVVMKKVTTTYKEEGREVYYDWINKKQRERIRYGYEMSEETVLEITQTTVDGQLLLENLPGLAPDSDSDVEIEYYAEITSADGRGHALRKLLYLRPWWSSPWSVGEDLYQHFSFSRGGGSEDEDEYDDWNTWTAGLGESFVAERTARVPEDEGVSGRMLYAVLQKEVVEYAVTGEDRVAIEQRPELLPNATLIGAYFDGAHIYEMDSVQLGYDYAEQELSVQIEADRESYRPGEAAELSVQVLDADGKPAAGKLLLSVVDEALLATQEYDRDPNPLYHIYTDVYWSAPRIAVSYRQYWIDPALLEDGDVDYDDDEPDEDGVDPSTGGGTGGGVQQYERSDFQDTALFVEAETDSDGAAVVPLALPDNITSWRATGVVVGAEPLAAGVGTANIIVTQPLFVQVVASEQYLAGEDLGASVRVRGADIAGDTPVRYHAELLDSAGKTLQQRDGKGRAGTPMTLNFGQVQPGSYTLSVLGRTNDEADLVSSPVLVSEDIDMEFAVSQRFTLGNDDLLDIHPSRYPVVVGFADARYATHMRAASELLYCRGDRADKVASALTAKAFLLAHSDGDWDLDYIPENIDDFMVQVSTGVWGIASQGYDSASPELTAQVLALIGEHMTRGDDLVPFLRRYAPENDSSVDPSTCAALMGLSAMGQPVLLDVRQRLDLLEEQQAQGQTAFAVDSDDDEPDDDAAYNPGTYENPSADPDGRTAAFAYLCTALALLGDEDGAAEAFERHLAPRLAQSGNLWYVQSVDGADYAATGLVLAAASAVGADEARGLADYLLAADNDRETPDFGYATYLKWAEPAEGGDAAFAYQKDGKTVTETLEQRGIRYISFMREDLEDGGPRVVSGEVDATLTYTGGAQAIASGVLAGEAQGLVSVDKQTRPTIAEDFMNSYDTEVPPKTEKDLEGLYTTVLSVVLESGAPVGSYTVSDRIPSPLRYVRHTDRCLVEDRTFSVYTIAEQEQQSIQFRFYHQGVFTVEEPLEDIATPGGDELPPAKIALAPGAGGKGSPFAAGALIPLAVDAPADDEEDSIEGEIEVVDELGDEPQDDEEELQPHDEDIEPDDEDVEPDDEPDDEEEPDWDDVDAVGWNDIDEDDEDWGEWAEVVFRTRELEGNVVVEIRYISRLIYDADWSQEQPVVQHEESGAMLMGSVTGGSGRVAADVPRKRSY